MTPTFYKYIAILVVFLAAIGYAGKKVYDSGYDSAHQTQQVIIDRQQKTYDNAIVTWKTKWNESEEKRKISEGEFKAFKASIDIKQERMKEQHDAKIKVLSAEFSAYKQSVNGVLRDPGKAHSSGVQAAKDGKDQTNVTGPVREDSGNQLSGELSDFLFGQTHAAEVTRQQALQWRDHAMNLEESYNAMVDRVNKSNGYKTD